VRPPLDRHAALAEVIADLTDPESPTFLNREHAAADRRTFRAAVAEAAQGRLAGTDFDWLLRRVQLAPEIQQLGGDHWAARAIVEAEQELIATAQPKAATPQARRAMPSPPPSPAARAALCRAAGRRRPTPPDELRAPHRPGRRREGRGPPRYGSSPWPWPVRRPALRPGDQRGRLRHRDSARDKRGRSRALLRKCGYFVVTR
jgi:hypothetical protein